MTQLPIPVHVGSEPPAWWDDIEARQREFGDEASPWLQKRRRPTVASATLDWGALGFEPRWVGFDTADCVVALQPSIFSGQGADEFNRFRQGAESRAEAALVISPWASRMLVMRGACSRRTTTPSTSADSSPASARWRHFEGGSIVDNVAPSGAEGVLRVILPKVRDPRFVTIRRGGTLTGPDHQLLALWAASCAEHVLDRFESVRPEDQRPRHAIEQTRAWARGDITMSQARTAGGHAMSAARDLSGAARHAAYAAGQAAVVAHVAAHELGAAAIKAARAAAPEGESDSAGRLECRWQRDQLPEAIRELVLDDQRLRNDICWSVFDC
jgi:hypothetical protein